jgi:nucleotide-binding universal stress UspA family protein
MYDDVLIPTDGTNAVQPAVDHALDLAETYGAALHALYVVDQGAYVGVDVRSDMIIETLETEGEEAVEAVEERAEAAGVPVTTAIVRGDPYREILDYADEQGVDLVVMGTHGRRGLDRYLLGSVTEKVVRSADLPVLTVRAPATDE